VLGDHVRDQWQLFQDRAELVALQRIGGQALGQLDECTLRLPRARAREDDSLVEALRELEDLLLAPPQVLGRQGHAGVDLRGALKRGTGLVGDAEQLRRDRCQVLGAGGNQLEPVLDVGIGIRELHQLTNGQPNAERSERALKESKRTLGAQRASPDALDIPTNSPRPTLRDDDLDPLSCHQLRILAPLTALTPRSTADWTNPEGACAELPSFRRPI